MHEREVVTYVRVRTQLQRLDCYGMGAQQEAASRTSVAFDCTIVAKYAKVSTGRKDHLRNRPQLVCLVAHASRFRALLVNDRLARSRYQFLRPFVADKRAIDGGVFQPQIRVKSTY